MTTQEKRDRLGFWYHVSASLSLIAAMFGLAAWVFLKARAGIVGWQAYPAFALFAAAVFAGDWLISRGDGALEAAPRAIPPEKCGGPEA